LRRYQPNYEHSIYDVATGLWMDRDGFFYEGDNPLEDAALDFPDLAD